MSQSSHEVTLEVTKAVPTITVSGLTFLGVGIESWVILLTIVYTLLQIYFLLRDKWYRPRKDNDGSN